MIKPKYGAALLLTALPIALPSIIALLPIALLSGPAQAQDTVNPSQQTRRLQPQPEAPSIMAPVDIPELTGTRPVSSADEVTFQLSGIHLSGAVHLPAPLRDEITHPYLNRDITFSDLQTMAAALTAAYRDLGYPLSRAIIPPQRISNGELTVDIIEGYINQVNIQTYKASLPPQLDILQRHGERLKQDRPLTTRTLERELLLANDLPGIAIRSILTPSAATPGASTLTFVTQEQRFSGYLGADNLNSRYLGDNEIIAAGYAHGLLGQSERIGVILATSAESSPAMAYGALSYQQPLTASGLSLFMSYSYSRIRPDVDILDLGNRAEAKTATLELSYPFIRSRNLNLRGSLGLYAANIRSSNELINPIFDDSVRNLNLNLLFNSHDRFRGENSMTLSFVQGLTALGGSSEGDANLSRSNASSDYRRMTAEFQRHQQLGKSFSLLLGLAGQYAFDNDLLASEEWAIGSTFYGRAYDVAEITGEHGLAGKLELRWDTFASDRNLQLFTFYEEGRTRQESISPDQSRTDKIESVGGGMRALLGRRINLELYVANPLNREVSAEQSRDSRIFFSLNTYF